MTLAYLLGVLFWGWLVVMLYRVLLQWRAARDKDGGSAGQTAHLGDFKRLAVLLRDEGNWVEWLVRGRIAAAVNREPEMQVVLVDGGSKDDTPQILERMARQLNMGFCRLEDLGGRCARTGRPGSLNDCGTDPLIECPAPCFEAAGLNTGADNELSSARTVRCVKFKPGVQVGDGPFVSEEPSP